MPKAGRGKNAAKIAPAPAAPGKCTDTARRSKRPCKNDALPYTDRCRSHRRPPMTALTAASVKMSVNGIGWRNWRFGDQNWQIEAWRMYDIIGELRKYANWIGAAVSKCRLYVAEIDENGEPGREVEDPKLAALAAEPLGKGPKKDEALRLLGTNLAVVGECYIVSEADGGPSGADLWYVVSGSELQQVGNEVLITRPAMAGLGGEFYYREGVDLLIRCWTPHPRRSMWADSSVRAAIPVLRKIETTMKRSFAELDSRLTGAGLLILPQNVDFPRGDNVPEGVDGFAHQLTATAMESIEDRASAPAMVPMVITVPPDSVDKIKFITFWSELSDKIQEMENASIKRLAAELDIPLEVITGMGDTSHWNAWAIAEETVRIFIEPVLQRIAEALDHGYLDAALEFLGYDPEKYTYAFDITPLTVKPNRGPEALALNAAGLLSDEETLIAHGYTDEVAQQPEERVRRLIEQALPQKPELLAEPVILKLLGLDPAKFKMEPPAAPVAAGQPGQGGGRELPAGTEDVGEQKNEQINRAEPATNPARGEATPAPVTAAAPGVSHGLHRMADLAMIRALGVAGSRLISHRERDRYPGTPKHCLHVRYGAITHERAEGVLRGVWEELAAAADPADGIHPARLQGILHGLAVDLLTRGMAYDRAELSNLIDYAAVHMRAMPVGAGA
jgi:hypothetical protein